jgi:hypothetical protein
MFKNLQREFGDSVSWWVRVSFKVVNFNVNLRHILKDISSVFQNLIAELSTTLSII